MRFMHGGLDGIASYEPNGDYNISDLLRVKRMIELKRRNTTTVDK